MEYSGMRRMVAFAPNEEAGLDGLRDIPDDATVFAVPPSLDKEYSPESRGELLNAIRAQNNPMKRAALEDAYRQNFGEPSGASEVTSAAPAFDLGSLYKAGGISQQARAATKSAVGFQYDLNALSKAGIGDVATAEKPAPSGFVGRLKDTGIDLAKGVVSTGESLVGLGSIATGGLVGKGMAAIGYDPKQTQEWLAGFQSDARQQEEQDIQAADGFWDTLTAIGVRPGALVGRIVQSIPGTVGAGAVGGAVARRIAATAAAEAKAAGMVGDLAAEHIATRVAEQSGKIVAAASGAEGAQAAGSIAEAGRQAGSDWTTYAPAALAGGAGTAVIGFGSGKLATSALGKRLGMGDIETDIAMRGIGSNAAQSAAGMARRVPMEAAKEGLLEEMPQSTQEKAFENIATGRPWDEHLGKAAAEGLIAGAGMGGGHALISGRRPDVPVGETFAGRPISGYTTEQLFSLTTSPAVSDAAKAKLEAELLRRESADTYQPSNVDIQFQPGTTGTPESSAAMAEQIAANNARRQEQIDTIGFEEQQAEQNRQRQAIIDATPETQRFIPANRLLPAPSGVDFISGAQGTGTPSQWQNAGLDQRATERQQTIASGILAHHSRPSPELLMRLMRVDQGMATMLFNHWQGLKNGEVAGNQGAQVPAEGGQRQGADNAGSGILDGQRDGAVSPALGQPSSAVASGGEPGMAMGAAGPDAVTPLEVQAHGAATSPFNARPQPTEAQKQAGNYAKGHVRFQGMDISIENPAGSVRSGKDEDGKAWENTLQHHYGYIKGTIGRDKDHLDVFIKPGAQSARTAYVVDQINPKTGKFDEHKIVLGADSEADARAIYHANYEQGWQGMGAITAMPIEQFKDWIKSGKTKKPVAYTEPKGVSHEKPVPKAKAPAAIDPSAPYGKVGVAPFSSQVVGLKDNGDGTATVMRGEEPFYDFENGDPVTVPTGATAGQIRQAVTDAGALSTRDKWFGVAKSGTKPAEAGTEPTKSEKQLATHADYTAPKSVEEARLRWKNFKGPEPERGQGHIALMDAVRKALDTKLFYNRDVENFVAKELGVTAEQRKAGTSEDPNATGPMDRVDGGAFGYDVYLAREVVESEKAKQAEIAAGERLKLIVGMNVGQVKLNDGKMAAAATVESLTPTGVVLTAKRGPQNIRITTGYVGLEIMAQRAGNEFFKKRATADSSNAKPVAAIAGKPVADMPVEQLQKIASGESKTFGSAAVEKASAELARRDEADSPPAAKPAPAESGVSTAEQVATAQELLAGVPSGEHVSEEDRKAAEQALGIYSLNALADHELRRMLSVLEVNKANTAKVMAMSPRPRSINDIADALGALAGAAAKKAEYERAFKRAADLAPTDEAVANALNVYTVEKLQLESIANERGMYGVKWAERNIGQRWTTQSIKVRKAKDRVVAAVEKASAELARRDEADSPKATKEPWQYGELEYGDKYIDEVVLPDLRKQLANAHGGKFQEYPSKAAAVRGLKERIDTLENHRDAKARKYYASLDNHYGAVRAALADGKPVPPVAYESYDDLKADVSAGRIKGDGQEVARVEQPQHIEAGQAEPATAPVIAASIKESAKNTPMNIEQAREWLLKQIDAAMIDAKSAAEEDVWDRAEGKVDLKGRMDVKETIGYKVFDVPGDGKFRVLNLKESLQKFKKQVAATPGFKKNATRPMSLASGNGGKTSVRDLLDDGEYVLAADYGHLTGKPLLFGAVRKGEAHPIAYTDAEPVDIKGIEAQVGREWNVTGKSFSWRVIETTTGASVSSESTKEKAISKALAHVDEHGTDKLIAQIKETPKVSQAELERQFTDWGSEEEAKAQKKRDAVERADAEDRALWNLIWPLKDGENRSPNPWNDIDHMQVVILAKDAAKAGKADEFVSLIERRRGGTNNMLALAARKALAEAAPKAKVAKGVIQTGVASKTDDTTLTVKYGGSDLDIDLGKPAYQATMDDVEAAVRARGYSADANPRTKYDPMQMWRNAHATAVSVAAKDGKSIPARVLYDYRGLIRDDLNDEQADLAADKMVEVFRDTKDYEKAVQAYRDFGRSSEAAKERKVGAGDTATAEKSSVAEKSAQQIEDFGEKIGGARKDVWSGFKDQIGEIPDDEIASQPFSKVWPAPDYQAMLDSGADPWSVAFMHAARDEVPAKPRAPYKVKRWAESVKLLRGMTTKILSGEYSVETVREKLSEQKNGLQKLASRVELYELVGHSKSLEGISFARHHYSIYRGREDVTLWAVEKAAKATAWSNWPTELATGDTKEEMLAAFKAKHAELNSEKAKSKEASFDIYSQGGEYFVGKKIGRNIMQLAGPFKTVKEARDHRTTHQEELSATLEKRKEIPQERRDTNNPRVGEDMRGGQDVTPQMFGEAFGFRGVEFGNWVEQGKRQSDLNEAYDALMDMAAILGVPPKALSLNGQLGLAFGARGTGGIQPAKAHYESDKVVINLTKKEGAGSLGHEWWHALDNYFSRIRAKNAEFMTEALDVSLASRDSEFIANTAVRKEMVAAFGKVIRAINGTALKARASKLDSKRTKEYWTTGIEMSARAFESYLISKLQDQNASNDYLANIVDEKTWKAAEALGFELDDSYPYPTAGEVPAIREAFDNFFRTVETKETDSGVAMFNAKSGSRGNPLDTAALEATIARVIAGSPSHFSRDTVVTAPLFSDLPAPILAKAKKEGYDANGRKPNGEKLTGATYDGKVYLVQENISSELEAEETLLHERIHQIVHGNAKDPDGIALRQSLGKLYTRAGAKSGIERMAKEAGIDMTGPLAAFEKVAAVNRHAFLAEEFLAHAEGQRAYEKLPAKIKRAIREFYGEFRDWLRGSRFVRIAEALGARLGDFTQADLAWTLKGIRQQEAGTGSKAIRFMTAYHGTPHESRAAPTNPQGPIWSGPESSRADDLIYTMQDKNVDLKRVQQGITKALGDIRDDVDAYLQEELFHGRAAKATEEFLERELQPFVGEMKQRGIDMDTLETFLWARHAKERNAQIAKINPDMPDGGSGLTDKQAADILAGKDVTTGGQTVKGVPQAKLRSLNDLAAKVDRMVAGNRILTETYELETPDTVAAWKGAYQHYVPLHREDADTPWAGNGTGQGYSVKGSSTKRATGSFRPVENILANLVLQRTRTITRGEKNRVAQALYGLAKESPNEGFWDTDNAPTIRTVENKAIYHVMDGKTEVANFTRMADAEKKARENPAWFMYQDWGDRVVEKIDPAFRSKPNVVWARFGGEDRFVIFNERDERAMRLAGSLKNLDADDISHLLGEVSRWTRYFASINTQYNPVFGVINLIRDAGTGLLNLKSTPLEGKQKEMLGNVWQALPAIYKAVRIDRQGGTPTGAWADLWEDFQEAGGKTGYRDMFKNSHEQHEALQMALDPTWWQGKWWGKALTVGGVLSVPEQLLADKIGKPVFEWLSDYNTAMENGIRLSAYKLALDEGMTKQRAASLAKNLTVNFNKKGQVARQAGALYAFFNASVQGTARMAETLHHGAKPGELLGAAGKQIVYGGMLLGAMQAMLLMMAGFDDEPPEFVRDRNIIIPAGGGNYLTVPLPLGFHVLPAIGRIGTEFVLGGFKKPGKHVAHVFDVLADSFNPIGNAGLSMQTLAPTVLDPAAALAENKDWTGKPIFRENMSGIDQKPGHARTKDTATGLSKGLAYVINAASGGTEFKPGMLSPTPDQIDYLIGQITGGVGRETSKAFQTGSAVITGEDLPTYKIPLVGRFYGDTKGQAAVSGKFYENLKEMNEHQAEFMGLSKSNRSKEAQEYAKENPEAMMFREGDRLQRYISKLRDQKQTMLAKGEPREKIKAVDDQITKTMQGFNQRVDLKKNPQRGMSRAEAN